MKNKIQTRLTLLLFLFFSSFSKVYALNDVSYKFNKEKVNASQDTFHFFRSFVDYYFYLIAANSHAINLIEKTNAISGWCVGDAHPENFGILLLENRRPIFTMNDMDDSGPCPVAQDLLRLLVSSRLYSHQISTEKILENYKDGLNAKNILVPERVKTMTKDALDAGVEVANKDLKNGIFKRKKSMYEVDSSTKSQINLLFATEFRDDHFLIQDIVGSTKTSGGSAGLLRYEILIATAKKELIKLELKELTTPSILPIATASIPADTLRMKKSLQMTQGNQYSHLYRVLIINGKTMLLRPKFGGNIGVSLDQSNPSDNKSLIEFEAYILGRIHANTASVNALNSALETMSIEKWEADITLLSDHFVKKFNELRE